MIGRLDTKWFSCGFCTERRKVVRESGMYSIWMSWGYSSPHYRRVSCHTHFPWGRAVKRLKASLSRGTYTKGGWG